MSTPAFTFRNAERTGTAFTYEQAAQLREAFANSTIAVAAQTYAKPVAARPVFMNNTRQTLPTETGDTSGVSTATTEAYAAHKRERQLADGLRDIFVRGARSDTIVEPHEAPPAATVIALVAQHTSEVNPRGRHVAPPAHEVVFSALKERTRGSLSTAWTGLRRALRPPQPRHRSDSMATLQTMLDRRTA